MKKLVNAALASALAAGAAAAMAQAPSAPPQPGPPGMMQGPGPGMRGPMMRREAMKPSDRAEARLAYIKTALKITPAQEPQWNAYAGYVRKTAAEMQQRFEARRQQAPQGGPRGPGGFQRPNAVERLERQQAMLAEANKRVGELLAVQKPLYDALAPEQRAIADEVLSPRRLASRGHGLRRG